MSATENAVQTPKADRLRVVEICLCVALAISLNCSLTISWVFLILGCVITLLRPGLQARLQTLPDAPLTIVLFVFCLAVTLSTLVNGGVAEIKNIFTQTRSFLVYFYVYQVFGRLPASQAGDGAEQKTLAALLCTAGLAGIYGTIQQIFNFHPFTYPYLQATGFLNAPMPFAGIMQLTSFLGLGILLRDGYKSLPGFLKDKRHFTAIVVANFMGLFFACERSAWLGMVAGLGIIFLRVSPRLFAKGLAGMAVVLALAWFCVPAVKARLAPLADPMSDVSVRTRVEIWQRCTPLIIAHPIVGSGPSHFPRITDMPEALVPGHSTDLNHAHSNYLQMLVTLGSIGLLSFFAILGISLHAAYKQSAGGSGDSGNWSGGVGLGVLGALVSLMVSGIFEYNFGAGQVKLAQWFVLGTLRSDDKKEG